MPARRRRISLECRFLGRNEGSTFADPSRAMPGKRAETFGTWINMYATDRSVCNLIRFVSMRLNARRTP
jgi:hypothetical protein